MEIKIIEDITLIDATHSIVYFSQSYLSTQRHHQLLSYSTNNIKLIVVVSDQLAISIPRSPFGSFEIEKIVEEDQFRSFVNAVKKDLKKRNIKQLVIHHPSKIYNGFISTTILEKSGFSITYADINQHIALASNWPENLHKMQKRKLQSLKESGFEFRKMESSELETAHQFISACRQVQGLTINIEWEQLQKLSEKTNAYESFGVFRDNKLSAVCITVKVSNEVAYYYLPATSPTFRTESPMVMLIEGMVNHYMEKGYKTFDMGVSSLLGKPQDSLIMFKERMGATKTEKPTYMLEI